MAEVKQVTGGEFTEAIVSTLQWRAGAHLYRRLRPALPMAPEPLYVPSGSTRLELRQSTSSTRSSPILDAQKTWKRLPMTPKSNGTSIPESSTVWITKRLSPPDQLAGKSAGWAEGKIQYRMRNAVFSRQRYWGEPVPAYWKDGVPLSDRRIGPKYCCLPSTNTCLPKSANRRWAGENWK